MSTLFSNGIADGVFGWPGSGGVVFSERFIAQDAPGGLSAESIVSCRGIAFVSGCCALALAVAAGVSFCPSLGVHGEVRRLAPARSVLRMNVRLSIPGAGTYNFLAVIGVLCQEQKWYLTCLVFV